MTHRPMLYTKINTTISASVDFTGSWAAVPVVKWYLGINETLQGHFVQDRSTERNASLDAVGHCVGGTAPTTRGSEYWAQSRRNSPAMSHCVQGRNAFSTATLDEMPLQCFIDSKVPLDDRNCGPGPSYRPRTLRRGYCAHYSGVGSTGPSTPDAMSHCIQGRSTCLRRWTLDAVPPDVGRSNAGHSSGCYQGSKRLEIKSSQKIRF